MENVLVDLAPQDLLAVQGEDSGKFLQGQLTCNVPDVTLRHFLPGAVCNNKGRVLGSFLLHCANDTHYLTLREGLLAPLKAHLDRYIVFYKAKTRDGGDDFRRLGLIGEKARALLAEHFGSLPAGKGEVLVRDGSRLFERSDGPARPRYELWLPAQAEAALEQQLRAELGLAPLQRWELEDLRQGLYFVGPQDSGEHTPQVLNYDLAGFISFNKGCYTGQEIVARMHYRGSAKRRLFPLRSAGAAGLPAAHAGVVDAASSRAGELLRLLPAPEGGWEGVALLDIDKARAGHLRLEDGQPVEIAGDAAAFSALL